MTDVKKMYPMTDVKRVQKWLMFGVEFFKYIDYKIHRGLMTQLTVVFLDFSQQVRDSLLVCGARTGEVSKKKTVKLPGVEGDGWQSRDKGFLNLPCFKINQYLNNQVNGHFSKPIPQTLFVFTGEIFSIFSFVVFLLSS